MLTIPLEIHSPRPEPEKGEGECEGEEEGGKEGGRVTQDGMAHLDQIGVDLDPTEHPRETVLAFLVGSLPALHRSLRFEWNPIAGTVLCIWASRSQASRSEPNNLTTIER
jgi:hypothetical protein